MFLKIMGRLRVSCPPHDMDDRLMETVQQLARMHNLAWVSSLMRRSETMGALNALLFLEQIPFFSFL